jgi:hypothetical protein
MSHSWDTAGVYRVAIYSEDENNALSGTAILTVFIDVIAKLIEDVIEGYLVDSNNDGTYDFFYDNVTGEERNVEKQSDGTYLKRNVEKQSDGTYLIDSDGDGNWDYIYDIETSKLYKYPESISEYFKYIALAIIALFSLSLFLFFVKRGRDKKLEQEKTAKLKKKQSIDKQQNKNKTNIKKQQKKKKNPSKKSKK